jgi:predicted DCC family thiol-disulfide oxidoreductase YuxK
MSDIEHINKKKRLIIFFTDFKLVISGLNTEIYTQIMENHKIVLFDGVCNFCNYWVNFAIRKDRNKKLRFAPLQGETARKLLLQHSINPTSLSSVILIDDNKAWTQSSAAIRICKYLDGGWKLFYGFIIIPKFIRDPIYNFIARNRYKWFGKKENCMIPSPEVKERFLI